MSLEATRYNAIVEYHGSSSPISHQTANYTLNNSSSIPALTAQTLPFSNGEQQSSAIKTERLCILFDAGETSLTLPLLKKWEKQGKDFRVLVTGTAETRIKPEMFPGKRITLKDLGIDQEITTQTPRTTPLSKDSLIQLRKIEPRLVLVGTASELQEQSLELFSESITIAFADNFNYDIKTDVAATASAVQAKAKHVLCPSSKVANLFEQRTRLLEEQHRIETIAKKIFFSSSNNVKNEPSLSLVPHSYHVVGKPTLEAWEKEIAAIDCAQVLQKLDFKPEGGPIITFIGGYGPGYEIINPLFAECKTKLESEGYQVNIQSHPKVGPSKVETTEALAVSNYIVGYNSSMVFDVAVLGKNSCFMIPDNLFFEHFAIDEGQLTRVKDCDDLLKYLREGKTPGNIREIYNIPQKSTKAVCKLIDEWLDQTSGSK